jgi:transposase-like protein
MEKHEETLCEANSKDYSMSFKLQLVQEIERGQLTTEAAKKYGIQNRTTVVQWLRKFGNFDWENKTPFTMSKSPEQKIMGLRQSKTSRETEVILERQAFCR